MYQRRFKIIIGLVIIFVAACIFIYTIFRGVFSAAPESEITVSPVQVPALSTTTPIVSSALPENLKIPSIGVDAKIQHTGMSKKGTMAVPTNYTDVGWYRHGPIPGSAGNAVIAGHLDNGLGLAAVFKRLSELKAGDDIYVTNASSTVLHFKVERKAIYGAASTTEEIFGPSSQAHLNLITCEGTWDPKNKMYSNREVVFANFVDILE